MKKVTTTTSKIKRTIVDSIPLNKRPLKEEKIITMAIFTKLLATKMVANNFLGFSNNLEIRVPLLKSLFCISSTSFCDKEKRATSEPEIKAEQTSNIIIAKIPKRNSKSIEWRKLAGSGSKLHQFS